MNGLTLLLDVYERIIWFLSKIWMDYRYFWMYTRESRQFIPKYGRTNSVFGRIQNNFGESSKLRGCASLRGALFMT